MKLRILSLLTLIAISSTVLAQKTGEEVFKEHACNACHMLTDMKIVGPGLAGILERRDRAWVKSWITNSTALIASGDEQAIAVFEENNNIPMMSYDIPDDELEALVDYIGGVSKGEEVTTETEVSKAPAEETAEKVEETPKIKEKSAFSKALEGRPLLISLFWGTIALLLLAILVVFGLSRTKKN